MINNNKEYKSCKKCAVGFYAAFMMNLILAGVMLGIMDIAKQNVVLLFAGVFIALTAVSLAVFISLLNELGKYLKSQRKYYVDKTKFDDLISFHNFDVSCCCFLCRETYYMGVSVSLFVDLNTGEIISDVKALDLFDFEYLISDLKKSNLVFVMEPVL